jgi:hypothetical protein
VATPPTSKAHRRGEERFRRGEALPSEEMGGGAHTGLALEMPRHFGALREEGRQLPGVDQDRLYPVVVSASAPFIPFEIVSKCRAILVRYEKKAANYLGLIKIACILLWYRRQHRLSLLR